MIAHDTTPAFEQYARPGKLVSTEWLTGNYQRISHEIGAVDQRHPAFLKLVQDLVDRAAPVI